MNGNQSQLINNTINIFLNTLFALCPFTVSIIKPFTYLVGCPKPSSTAPGSDNPCGAPGSAQTPPPGPTRQPEAVSAHAHRSWTTAGKRDRHQHEPEEIMQLRAGGRSRCQAALRGLCCCGGTPRGQRGKLARSGRCQPAAASRRQTPAAEPPGVPSLAGQRGETFLLPAELRDSRAYEKIAFLQWVCFDRDSVSS